MLLLRVTKEHFGNLHIHKTRVCKVHIHITPVCAFVCTRTQTHNVLEMS